jgi:2-polyprenyl-6-methoxyphenol hydroxylase-like FAD-dependent oxidoreductase
VVESASIVFARLVECEPPTRPTVLMDTACVLGGSIAGLLAARVLSDHARRVVVIERDAVDANARPRPGVPQDQQVHTLLPGGLNWLERWLPGFTDAVEDGGGVVVLPGRALHYTDGHPEAPWEGSHRLLTPTRPFLESCIRASVLALPNVTTVQAQATGLEYHDGRVSGVRTGSGDVLAADFVVDAMGRPSRLSDWLSEDGYDRPVMQRVHTGINYATTLFKRSPQRPANALIAALALYSPPYLEGGVAVAAVNAVEDMRWLVMLMGYDEERPGRTLEEFRKICAKLPPIYAEAADGDPVTEEILTYHQADTRRRDFVGLTRFPAGLISVGDAVASFNPIYGQGMSSAALHGSCLSEYLRSAPDLGAPATAFFGLQKVVVDAAWAISAGGDTARLDALSGAAVPEEVAQQRWALRQLQRAALVDGVVATALHNVTFMLAHPDTLADPALLERAQAASQSALRPAADCCVHLNLVFSDY